MTNPNRWLLALLTVGVLALALRPFTPVATGSGEDDKQRLAVCSIPTIVNELMATDRFVSEREEITEDFEERREDLQRELERIAERGRGMDEDDPALPALGEEFRTLQNELGTLRREFAQRTAELQAEQLAACYELARSSAIAVGEDLGYDFVIASGSPDEELNRTNAQQLLGQLSRRPMIMFPDEHDITDDVRDDLNL